jgi:pectin methylesterase-like acyl-CoA thioesterase
MKKLLVIFTILSVFFAACEQVNGNGNDNNDNNNNEQPNGNGEKEENVPIPPTALIQFNAPQAAYDGSGPVGGFGSGEHYLLWGKKIDLANDTISIQARVKYASTSGHNGLGFISLEGSSRKGYSLITAQNIKNTNAGTLGGSQLSPQLSWETGTDKSYVLKAEIKNGQFNFYAYDTDGTTLLGSKTGLSAASGYKSSDLVYAAIGGTQVQQGTWSEIKVTDGETEYLIDSLLPQSTLPTLSAQAAIRVSLNARGSIPYSATGPGGAAAEVTAVSDDPSAVRIDEVKAGEIIFTALKTGTVNIMISNKKDTSLTLKVAVTVTDFPESDDYGVLTAYPAPGAAAAYTDGELMLTFDAPPALEPGGSVCVYDKATGDLVDTILFADEKQTCLGTSNNIINVGPQLARVSGNSIYVTPHFGKLEYGASYYIAIPKGAISGVLNGKTFTGLSDQNTAAAWSFTTRAAPSTGTVITVDGSQASAADFRTVYGALKAIASIVSGASNSGDYTINVAPGVYTELVHYSGSANVTINGTGSAKYGGDVIIQYTNCNDLNGGTHTRASFYFSGANLVLKNLTLKNTTERGERYLSGVTPTSNSQAETVFFANGTGRTFAAYNCSFLSHQDTIQTTGRSWLYKCYIEGDTDYIWGTADACLIEDCELVSVNDPKKSTKEAVLLVARTGSTSAQTVGKGYVIFNSKVKTEDGMTTYFGRNPGTGAYYDQCAVVNSAFTGEGTGQIGAGIWRGTAYTFLDGAAEHVGWKVYGNTVDDAPQNTEGRLANTSVISEAVYSSEYHGRNAILNRVYNKSGVYEPASAVWDLSGLETAFDAAADASKN